MSKGPDVSPVVTAALLCLVIGGAAGYYVHYFTTGDAPVRQTAAQAAGGGGRMGGGGGYGGGGGGYGGGMGGGGGYGGGGRAPAPGTTLARLVRNIDTMEAMQGKGLTPAQAKSLAPILTQLKAAATLPDADAEKQTAAIQKVLTPDQAAALESLQPQFGGGGGRGGGGGGYGGGAPGGGGYGGGGGRPDPLKPFANERNQKALDDLISKASKV